MEEEFSMGNDKTIKLESPEFYEGETLLSQMGQAGKAYVKLRARHAKGVFFSRTKLAHYQNIFDLLLGLKRLERTALRLEAAATELNA